jgi:hypothetical protein
MARVGEGNVANAKSMVLAKNGNGIAKLVGAEYLN